MTLNLDMGSGPQERGDVVVLDDSGQERGRRSLWSDRLLEGDTPLPPEVETVLAELLKTGW